MTTAMLESSVGADGRSWPVVCAAGRYLPVVGPEWHSWSYVGAAGRSWSYVCAAGRGWSVVGKEWR